MALAPIGARHGPGAGERVVDDGDLVVEHVGLGAVEEHALVHHRLLIGMEADVTFPNAISGSHLFFSATNGQARYDETVQMSGTVRGRIGYAPNGWLVYATGGLGCGSRQH